MPLVKGNLVNSFKTIFKRQLPEVSMVAEEMSLAYNGYAAVALGANGDPIVLLGHERMKIKLALETMMRMRMPPPNAANMIAQGVMGFWLLPPVLSSGGGACASIIPAAGIAKLITSRKDKIDDAAMAFADALHLMTKTVGMVYPPPIPPGLIK